MNADYREGNERSRQRLRALVSRLKPSDFAIDLGGGWNVKAALLHAAFWDRYAAVMVEDWSRDGFTSLDENADQVNRASLPDWLAATPDHALSEVLAAAETSDALAAIVGEPLLTALIWNKATWVCERSFHRDEHIDEIERVVGLPD